MGNVVPKVTPRNRAAWRAWLEKHHASRLEVWLVFFKRQSGKPTLSYNDAVEEALCFGWIDGVKRSIDEQRYCHRFSPRRPKSRWSPTNRRRAQEMIKAGLMTPVGLQAIAVAKRSGCWEPTDQHIDVSLPPELATWLKRQRGAAAFFASLAPSYRAQFTAWINAAKRPETRAKRVAEAKQLIARGEKLGMR